MIEKTAGLSVRFAGVARASARKRAAIIGFGSRLGFPCDLADLNEQMLLLSSHSEKTTCPYQLEDGPALHPPPTGTHTRCQARMKRTAGMHFASFFRYGECE